jgi:hypothetical protein
MLVTFQNYLSMLCKNPKTVQISFILQKMPEITQVV